MQGGFGALLIPQGIGILIGTFSREQIPRAVSAFGPVMGASAVLGPIVAGFISSADIAGLTWRPIFLINIALGATGFVAALKLLPHDDQASAVPIDGLGAGLLLGLAFFAAVSGLAYVISLFFQTALGLKASAAAIALSPLMAGIQGDQMGGAWPGAMAGPAPGSGRAARSKRATSSVP